MAKFKIKLSQAEVELIQGLIHLGEGELDLLNLSLYEKSQIEQVFANLRNKVEKVLADADA